MIFPDFDVDALIDAQIICRLWHATQHADRKLRTFDPQNIDPHTQLAISALDPDTYSEMFVDDRRVTDA